MKKFFLVSLFFLSFLMFSQGNYKKGRIVKNNDSEIECYINNKDWAFSPSKIIYKLNENDRQVIEEDITLIKSFEIYDIVKYRRFQMEIDISSNKIHSYSNQREPDYKNQTFFAKEIITGNLSLFEYTTNDYERFILLSSDGLSEQLIYKKYKNQSASIAENNDFKKQIVSFLKCTSLDLSILQTIKYDEKDLKNIVLKNNICLDSDYVPTDRIKLKGDFNLNTLAKLNLTSFELNDSRYGSYGFDTHYGIGVGLEFEYVLPVNNYRWAILLEPSYSQFNSNASLKLTDFSTDNVTVSITNLDFAIGLRYYLFLKNRNKIYLSFSPFFSSSINNSYIDRSLFNDYKLSNRGGINYSIGLGTKVYDKFIVECRYVSYGSVPISSTLTTQSTAFSFILGYSFF